MIERRLWSAAALVLALETTVLAILVAVERFPDGLSVLACLLLAAVATWEGLCRRGSARTLGLATGAVLFAAAIALEILEERILEDLLLAVGIVGTLAATRMAFRLHVRWPRAIPPRHPVMLYNPLSGDGKAVRLNLVDQARRRGIEPIEVRAADDVTKLIRNAVGRGADAVAMAGGDGSQATAAKIASELGLPYACIPAGTHNHFALDLGVDRSDVVGALDALIEGTERRVDLAEVNGRVFVNNVSLGLYAGAVRRPEYRHARLQALLDTVPDVLGPDAEPPHLSWSGATEEKPVVAMVVSNNAYRLGHALGSGTRPRLDDGVLGITVLRPNGAGVNGTITRSVALRRWTAATLEIQASAPLAAGIDGEPAHLDPPLRFLIRPKTLRVRIAQHHPGASPSALHPDTPWKIIEALVTFVIQGGPRDPPQSRPPGPSLPR